MIRMASSIGEQLFYIPTNSTINLTIFPKQSTITLFGLYAIASVNEAPYRGLKIRLMLKFITWLMVMANRNIK